MPANVFPSPSADTLVEALRLELREYGEMMALLDQQQEAVMARAADEVLRSAMSISQQLATVQNMRQAREAAQAALASAVGQSPGAQAALASAVGQSPGAPFATLCGLMPPKYRLPVETLVRENNQLLGRVQARVRQNHLLLSRSLQLTQQLLNTLVPRTGPTTYSDDGAMRSTQQGGSGLYEAVG